VVSPDRRLFVYGTLLEGEPGHGVLEGSESLGAAQTEPAFQLVDLGPYAALIPGGTASIVGELYRVAMATVLRIDVLRQVPILFDRARIRLADGSEADAYVMTREQARGRRTVHHGDWRKRFSSDKGRPVESSFIKWSRNRSR
jgi:gamma-glutamylcyclotransferase (GGCT)/AIG2-like uncharacterized protein YtfP